LLFDKIDNFCKKNNLPLYLFERKCGLGNGTISGWKTASPRIDSLQKVAKEMGITVDELISSPKGGSRDAKNKTT